MFIDSRVYQVFFEILRSNFIEKEWSNEIPQKAKGPNSREIWNLSRIINGKKIYRASELFAGHVTENHLYLQRRHEDLDPSKTSGGAVDTLTFIKALEYIGIKPSPENMIKWESKSSQEKADILYYKFLAENEDRLPPFDEIKFTSKERLLTKQHITTSPDLEDSAIMAARLTVQKFYESLAKSNTQTAWTLLTDILKGRQPWNGDYEKFHIGYTNTSAIKEINVFGVKQQNSGVIECNLSYDDHVLVYTNKDLSSLDTLSLLDLDEFVRKVESLKTLLANEGVEHLEKIELYRLFDPAVSEHIWYKFGLSPVSLPDLFPVSKTHIIKRLVNVTCCMVDGNWLINRIHTLRSISLR